MAIPLPGPYEVSKTIQDILQRRRDEARQAMLDKLNADNTQSEMAYRTGQLELSRASDKRAGEKQTWDQNLEAVKMVPGGANPSDVDPVYAALAERLGLVRNRRAVPPTIVPSGGEIPVENGAPTKVDEVGMPTFSGGVDQPFLPGNEASREFVGNEDYQKRTRAQEEIDAMMGQFKDDPDMLRALMLVRNGASDSVDSELTGPKPSVQMVTPGGAKGALLTGERGTSFQQTPHPPSAYFPSFQAFFDPTPRPGFPQGGSVSVGNRPNAQGQIPVLPITSMDGTPVGQLERPGTSTDNIPNLNSLSNELRKAYTATGPNKEAGLNQARNNLIAGLQRSLPPNAASFVSDVADELAARSADGRPIPTLSKIMSQAMAPIKQDGTPAPPFKSEELAAINAAIRQILNPGPQ